MSKCIYRSVPNMKEARKRIAEAERLVDHVEVSDLLKNFAKGKKFFIKTFGCQANIRDEEIMAGYLKMAGYERTEDPKECDLAIINTCAVRENAEDKVYGELGSFKAKAEKDPNFILCLCGCMMQQEGFAEMILKTYPFVTLVFGTHNVHRLLPLLTDVLKTKKHIVDVESGPKELVEDMPSERLSSSEAFVNISYGCDKFCTYCIVPYTRGKERSRKVEDIVKECKQLVEDGYKQITLLGQNVNSYGLDLKDGTTFAQLLEEVAKLGVPRLTFLTSYPSQFTDEMIEVMAKYDNIRKWLHFPVQSGSTSCLRRMGRRYTREEYLALVKKIREKMPDIALTTDIIVGFPNETDEEFADTLSLCEEVGYSAAFTFIYSPRKGTPAAALKDDTPDELKHERFNALVKVIEKTTGEHSAKMVGNTYSVLVEGPSKKNSDVLSGYAENGKLINFPGPAYLTGCIVDVKVLESKNYSLRGELVGDPILWKAKDVAYVLSLDPLLKEYKNLSEALKDPKYVELGMKFEAAKKALALSMGDDEKYAKCKEEFLAISNLINNDPLIKNKEALVSEVGAYLERVRALLS